MSGSKQHYIPRLLLRAFRQNPKGKVSRVFVYRPDRNYISPVEDVAAERFFYSELASDGSETLDDVITAYENGLASDIASFAAEGPVAAEVAARVVSHLLVRGDHVRGVMREGAAQFAALIAQMMGSDEKVAAMLGLGGPNPSAQFRENFTEKIADNELFKLMALPEPVSMSLAYMMLRESAQQGFSEVTDAVSGLVKHMEEQGPSLARDAHVRSLSSSLAPQARLDTLKELHWRVEQVEAPSFVLPDFVGLAFDREGGVSSLIGIDRDDLAALMMPLSPSRMLIGSRGDVALDVARFNSLAVPHCLSFFVSAYASPDLETLAVGIGSAVKERLRQTLDEASSDFRLELKADNEISATEAGAWHSNPPSNVELHIDFLTPEEGQRLSSILAQIIAFAHRRFDLSALLRIHISSDYEGCLASLNRGTMTEREAAPTASEHGLSVAYNVKVEQNGIYGTATVLRDSIARNLLSDDDQEFSFAVSVVMGQMARIGFHAFLKGVFPDDVAVGAAPDTILTPYAAPAWESWLVASHVCLFETGRRDFHREQLLERLGSLRSKLEPIRRNYRLHGDVDKLLQEALSEVAQVLSIAAAAVVDVAEGLSDAVADEQFASRLRSLGYLNWIDLFTADLRALWREGTAYPSQEAFFVLNRHLERLLLAGAIFIWDDGDQGKVEVPYWSDWEWILAEANAQQNGGSLEADPTQ